MLVLLVTDASRFTPLTVSAVKARLQLGVLKVNWAKAAVSGIAADPAVPALKYLVG